MTVPCEQYLYTDIHRQKEDGYSQQYFPYPMHGLVLNLNICHKIALNKLDIPKN